MIIHLATTPEQILRAFPALRELRPHLIDPEDVVTRVQRQMDQGYQLVLGEIDGTVTTAAGFRFLETLKWGRFLYVDDLVTLPGYRGRGAGGLMMDWLIAEARRSECEEIHLDSGTQRFAAHGVYHRHGLRITSHHFSMRLKSS